LPEPTFMRPKRSREDHRVLRRDRERSAFGTHTKDVWLRVCDFFGTRCLRCGTTRNLTKDHIVPLNVGGDNTILNLQPLCFQCNSSKHTSVSDYRPEYMNMSCE
jgi:5-methylcytosine-specific restriction endonuclease McrA